ncbi:MAG: FAD-dependent oxidoreductase [Mesorhizobium sp.]|nr:MAG: FAD-dependent oxidoreductase [Mesorhizobium sp.]TIQ94165.1 MAG: FAD-dependent oxidoreductase [Mesorhizobium sp.]
MVHSRCFHQPRRSRPDHKHHGAVAARPILRRRSRPIRGADGQWRPQAVCAREGALPPATRGREPQLRRGWAAEGVPAHRPRRYRHRNRAGGSRVIDGTKGVRSTLLELNGKSFEAVVIGGGINGAASANRLAGAGYEVLLIDAGDFGSGSSSRSSRIMHCGLNYLAAAADATTIRSKISNVALAGQMMRERRRLRSVMGRRISPHTFYIPLRAGDPVAPWKYDLAFAVLNALSGWDSTLDYRRYRQDELGHIGITRYLGGGLTGLAAFTEYVFDWPERICVDHVLDAAAYGAMIRNYTELVAAHSGDGRWRVTLADRQGEAGTAEIDAKLLLNLAGPGSDLVHAACGLSDSRTVTPNKGCHIAVRLPEEFRGAGVISRNELGHLFLCVPWKNFHILGPTETPLKGFVRDPVAGEEDVASILDQANATLPSLGLTKSDVMFAWAGLRPATYDPGNPRGSWRRTIYEHLTRDNAPMVSVSWGRLADHSFTASDMLARARKYLGPRQRRARWSEQSVQDMPGSVEDILFRRTGVGWSADLGLSEAARAAAELQGGGSSAEKLVAGYIKMLAERFGYED